MVFSHFMELRRHDTFYGSPRSILKCFHLPESSSVPFRGHPHFPWAPRSDHSPICSPSPWSCLFQMFHATGVVRCVVLRVWLFSLWSARVVVSARLRSFFSGLFLCCGSGPCPEITENPFSQPLFCVSLHVFGCCKSSKLVSPSGALQVTAFPSSSSLLTPPSLTQTQGCRRSPTAGPPSSAQPTSSLCGNLGREHPWWPLDPSVSSITISTFP